MANVAHSTLTGANLHEPKGVAAATVGTVYVADGAGSGAWVAVPTTSIQGGTVGSAGLHLYSDGAGGIYTAAVSHGSCTFVNIITPSVIATPTVFTKVAPTTVASGHGVDVTEGTDARLTYTGAHMGHFSVRANLCFGHTAAADRDASFVIAKNGTVIASSEQLSTCPSGAKHSVSVQADLELTNTDYVEVFTKLSGTGNVQVYLHNFVLERI